MTRSAVGTGVAIVSMVVLTAVMLPLRDHLSIATTALVLVVPVVIGVITGGYVAGAISVVGGFLVYDYFFIPPYLTLWVGALENWAALAVYVAVMLPISHVVGRMNSARAEARRQGREIRELFELSHLLLEDKPLDVLLSTVVTTVADVFDTDQVALLLADGDRLAVASAAGMPLSEAQLRRIVPSTGELATLDFRGSRSDGLLVLALTAAGRPVGLLVLSGQVAAGHEGEPLRLFANHIALALERARLREEALQARLADEVSRLAKTMVSAVSHDLRAPLAALKAASSMLADPDLRIGAASALSLARLIDAHADQLADLVENLLDMSRVQAGVLKPRSTVVSLSDLVAEIVDGLPSGSRGHSVRVEVPEQLPPIDVDLVLIGRVLTNLLENAFRHSPKTTAVTIAAARHTADRIEVSVTDSGPGVGRRRRAEIFSSTRRDEDVGAGLGLTFAKTFVEAHGQRIWVEDAPGGGARFCFTLPIAAQVPEEAELVAHSGHR